MILFLILAVAAAVRLPLVTTVLPFYISDTAVLDLMARHFLRGEFSLYYWGFHYYGVLDPILLMPLFRFFGATPQVSQIVPAAFSLLLLLCYHQFIRRIENSLTAHLATLFLAVASPSFLHFTFTTYNYVLGPLFGFIFLLLALAVWERPQDRRLCWLLGIVSGFGRYYFGLILFFWVAAGMTFGMQCLSQEKFRLKNSWTFRSLWHQWVLLEGYHPPPILKKTLVFVNFINLGNLLMAIVLWFHGDFIHRFGSQTVKIFFGPTFKFSIQAGLAVAVVVEWRRVWRAICAFWSYPSARSFVLGYLIGYLPALIGCLIGNFPNVPSNFMELPQIYQNLKIVCGNVVPYFASLCGYPLLAIPTIILLSGSLGLIVFRFMKLVIYAKERKPPPRWAPMVFLFAINVFVGLCYLRLGDAWNGRYFLPAYFSLALGIVYVIYEIARFSRVLAGCLFCLLLANNLVGDYVLISENRSQPAFFALADQLLARGCRGGYADYFVGYRLTAVADERLIFAATGDNNLYPPYLSYVRTLDNPILIEDPSAPRQETVTLQGMSYHVLHREIIQNTSIAWLEKNKT